jgi:hypothetical protein
MTDYRDLFWNAMGSYEVDPENSVRLISQAVALARTAGDHVFVLYMNHWKLQIMIYELRAYHEAFDLAVATALEGRKPAYAHMKEHVCVQQDLIFCYLGTDPVGNASMIEDAIASKGQRYWESRCRLDRVRLLKEMDQPYEDEMAAAEAVIQTLKAPQALLAELQEISA